MNATELINRYVHAVRPNLPERLQADVSTELRSLLEDALEERAAAAGQPSDGAMAVEVLREFGRPRDVARRYGSPAYYLIGPELVPAYLITILILLNASFGPVLGASFMVLATVDYAPAMVGSLIRNSAPNWIAYRLMVLGLVTLVFALLERALAWLLPRRTSAGPAWDPRTLPRVKDPEEVNPILLLAWTGLSIALLLLFNVFPSATQYFIVRYNTLTPPLLLAPEFAVHLPWLNTACLLGLGLNLVVWRQVRWRRATRRAELGLWLLSGVILCRMLLGGPLMNTSMATGGIKAIVLMLLLFSGLIAGLKLYGLVGRKVEPGVSLRAG